MLPHHEFHQFHHHHHPTTVLNCIYDTNSTAFTTRFVDDHLSGREPMDDEVSTRNRNEFALFPLRLLFARQHFPPWTLTLIPSNILPAQTRAQELARHERHIQDSHRKLAAARQKDPQVSSRELSTSFSANGDGSFFSSRKLTNSFASEHPPSLSTNVERATFWLVVLFWPRQCPVARGEASGPARGGVLQ